MLKKTLTGSVLVLSLVGCGKTIDGSDREAYDASMKAIISDMSTSEKLDFVRDAATACPVTLKAGQPTFVDDACLEVLDGKDVEEVRKLAEINRVRLQLKEAEAMLRMAQNGTMTSPPDADEAVRITAEVDELKAKLKGLGAG